MYRVFKFFRSVAQQLLLEQAEQAKRMAQPYIEQYGYELML